MNFILFLFAVLHFHCIKSHFSLSLCLAAGVLQEATGAVAPSAPYPATSSREAGQRGETPLPSPSVLHFTVYFTLIAPRWASSRWLTHHLSHSRGQFLLKARNQLFENNCILICEMIVWLILCCTERHRPYKGSVITEHYMKSSIGK